MLDALSNKHDISKKSGKPIDHQTNNRWPMHVASIWLVYELTLTMRPKVVFLGGSRELLMESYKATPICSISRASKINHTLNGKQNRGIETHSD